MASDVRLLAAPFDPGAQLSAFTSGQPYAGGVVSFLGQVRSGGGVEALELRHFEPLTLPGMKDVAARALARWRLDGVLALHRIGLLNPGDPIVLVATAARHRRDAFAAAEYVMDHLKSESWFWKRERAGGAWRWIEPRPVDFADLARWEKSAVD